MQSQLGWNAQQAMAERMQGGRLSGWQQSSGVGGPYSFPGTRPVYTHTPSWATAHGHNEDYGNLVSQGYGPSWQGEHPVGSPHSESCCSPPGEAGWISPMEAPPVYLSPFLLQSSLPPPFTPFTILPSHSAASQSSVSDSEEETVCARSPDSGPYYTHAPNAQHMQANVFEMDMDEPSVTTTTGDDEDADEEIDDEFSFDGFVDDMDTSVDYSFLRGATESRLDIERFDVQLNASKTPCLDALAFCVVMRLGCYQTPEDVLECSITITNFPKLLTGIHHFCPKKSQTANEEARIKALKRWFEGIPTKRKRDSTFVMRIKDRKNPVVYQIIKKIQKLCIARGYVRALNPHTQQALHPMG